MENIRKYTYMSEEQFLNQMELDERCPFEFNLKSFGATCNEGKYDFECKLCWKNAITDIQFNDPLVTFEKKVADLELKIDRYYKLNDVIEDYNDLLEVNRKLQTDQSNANKKYSRR